MTNDISWLTKGFRPSFQSIFVVIMDTTDHLMGDTVSFSFDVADTEVLPESEVVMSSEEEESGIICQLMDIREPLLKLRSVLEQKLGCDLSEHDFWLQVLSLKLLLSKTLTPCHRISNLWRKP